jgi:hypothetical protein
VWSGEGSGSGGNFLALNAAIDARSAVAGSSNITFEL